MEERTIRRRISSCKLIEGSPLKEKFFHYFSLPLFISLSLFLYSLTNSLTQSLFTLSLFSLFRVTTRPCVTIQCYYSINPPERRGENNFHLPSESRLPLPLTLISPAILLQVIQHGFSPFLANLEVFFIFIFFSFIFLMKIF